MAETKKITGSPKGITIVCHGQFYYKTETEKGIKSYDQTVRAPSLEFFKETSQKYIGTDDKSGRPKFSTREYINVRGMLKKRLLPIMLSKKFKDFARVRFVVIDEIVSESGETLDLPITLQSRKQLAELIKNERYPINVDEYLNIDELRTDILEYQEDPDSFNRDKERRDKRRLEERQFMEMNDLGEALPPAKKQNNTGANSGQANAGGIMDL